MACKNRVFVSTRVEAAKLLPSSVARATELLDTTTAGPRTVPVRSPLAGVKTLEFSRPPRPRDVLQRGPPALRWQCQDAPAGADDALFAFSFSLFRFESWNVE